MSFQLGFCVFALSNYMKTIPHEMYEAAPVDGASLWTRFWKLTLPLSRPALAALATLLTTWIYNDFFWAITLISSGNKRPITSALANLRGQFVANQNLTAAMSAASSERLVVRDRDIQVDTAAGFPLPGRSRTARDRAISRAVNQVAHYLGNTPAVCRRSCIDPPLLDRGAGCTQPAHDGSV